MYKIEVPGSQPGGRSKCKGRRRPRQHMTRHEGLAQRPPQHFLRLSILNTASSRRYILSPMPRPEQHSWLESHQRYQVLHRPATASQREAQRQGHPRYTPAGRAVLMTDTLLVEVQENTAFQA